MGKLVAQKRAQPAEDVLSGLCSAAGGHLSDEHVASLGALLLFAGHETTVVRIHTGTLLFLTHQAAQQSLLDNPELIMTAVEEILRTSDSGSDGLTRYARADIDISGVSIKAGEAVLLNTGAANHDAREFGDPDLFKSRVFPTHT